ncbi:AraC family transcriptional regulator [Ferruginibacter paludis]|uniref:helix-turn-helix domain-containing protein n=1 Tax=Ferruginibacter paludis TaxID=1310417 RepID=UPI0025B4DB88|nr:AraC family transcriptional regulator [Ferruginibacter paludis]MDN3655756.1 AraC family transcriptional regulator [Ferruginibacter paludis]
MTIFTYDFSDYENYCKEFAALLQVPYENNTVRFPEKIASGQVKLLSFPNGLQAIIHDCVLHQDFTWQRMASLPEIFILRVDYVEIKTALQVNLDGEVFRDTSDIYSSIVLTSSRFGLDITLKKGTVLKTANIIIMPEWLKKYLPADAVNYWLHALRSLKLKGLNMVPMDFNTRQSLFSIINMPASDPAYNFKALTRVFEITDYYFKKINVQFKEWDQQQKRFDDIDKIIELDVFLTRDFNQPAPTLDEMATSVHMSPSKLKTLFKKTYGQSIYEYFNASRLNQARHLLLENNLSIKEVAWQMGYSAVSNFSAAFKKQFHISPGEMLTTPY